MAQGATVGRGTVYTFYSYKGGVGRSMALANVAALLAKWGKSVLVVDWDLEAPGIERFFESTASGLSSSRGAKPGVVELISSQATGVTIDWRDCLLNAYPSKTEHVSRAVSIITAGRDAPEYTRLVQGLDWEHLFKEHHLGQYIEQLREEWTATFEFVLIDSRTGITDIGGICTIHLPDVLVLLFTTNRQSLDGVIEVMKRARQAHEQLPFDRGRLLGVPVPARDESRTEYQSASKWRRIFASELADLYQDWLPKDKTPTDAIELLRIPYIPYWSFGERMPVVEEGTTDPTNLGFAYEVLARLIANQLEWGKVLEGAIEISDERTVEAMAQEAEVTFNRFTTEEQVLVRRVLTWLVRMAHPDEGGEDTRQIVKMESFEQSTKLIVETLANTGLVVVKRNEAIGEDSVELAHRGLIGKWERLKSWIDEDRDFLLWRQQLHVDTAQWERNDRDDSLLLRGISLGEAVRWKEKRPDDMNQRMCEFIQQSLASSEKEESRRKRRKTLLRLAVIGGLAILLVITTLVVFKIRQVMKQNRITHSQRLAGQALSHLGDQLDLALLLSIEACEFENTIEARSSLLNGLKSNPQIRTFLHGHASSVYSVAFSYDRRTLASGSRDKTIILWDVATHRRLGEPLIGHGHDVLSVAFSPDGKTLASGSIDSTIIFWDVMTHQPLGEPLTGHRGYVVSVAFSPDGKTLASGSIDSTIVFWDVMTHQPLGEPLTGHGGYVKSVAFSPDGKTLASGSMDRTIIFWDIAARQPLYEPLTGHTDGVLSVAFSFDGTTLASGSRDQTIILWDIAARLPLYEPLTGHMDGVLSVAFGPDGKILASGSRDQTIILWDIATRPPLGEPLIGYKEDLLSLAFSSDGKKLASGSMDRTIIFWDIAARQPVGEPLIGHKAVVWSVAFSPDGKTLASGSGDQTIILWDIATRQPLGEPLTGHMDHVLSVAFSPDGKKLASGSMDSTIIFWDIAARQPLGEPLTGHMSYVLSVAFSPDGKTLASGSGNQTIILWDIATGRQLGEPLRGHKADVWSVAFSPDGQTLASGSGDQTIILWDIATHQPVGEPLIGHEANVLSVAFSPDGKTLASGSGDQTIILWDIATGRALGEPLRGHKADVWSVAFSPDGKTLASGSGDQTIILWDIATRQPVGEPLIGHKAVVWSVAFSPDGKTLASVILDKIFLVDVDLESWKSRACSIANRNLTRDEWSQYLNDKSYRPTCQNIVASDEQELK